MKAIFRDITLMAATLLGALSCSVDEIDGGVVRPDDGQVEHSVLLAPACLLEGHGLVVGERKNVIARSLVDQITTKQLKSNFLRIDEDLDALNDGR